MNHIDFKLNPQSAFQHFRTVARRQDAKQPPRGLQVLSAVRHSGCLRMAGCLSLLRTPSPPGRTEKKSKQKAHPQQRLTSNLIPN